MASFLMHPHLVEKIKVKHITVCKRHIMCFLQSATQQDTNEHTHFSCWWCVLHTVTWTITRCTCKDRISFLFLFVHPSKIQIDKIYSSYPSLQYLQSCFHILYNSCNICSDLKHDETVTHSYHPSLNPALCSRTIMREILHLMSRHTMSLLGQTAAQASSQRPKRRDDDNRQISDYCLPASITVLFGLEMTRHMLYVELKLREGQVKTLLHKYWQNCEGELIHNHCYIGGLMYLMWQRQREGLSLLQHTPATHTFSFNTSKTFSKCMWDCTCVLHVSICVCFT